MSQGKTFKDFVSILRGPELVLLCEVLHNQIDEESSQAQTFAKQAIFDTDNRVNAALQFGRVEVLQELFNYANTLLRT